MDQRICIMVWASYQGRADLWGTWLDAPVYFIYKGKIGRTSKLMLPLRYIRQAQETWLILNSKRPRLVLVTNPPILAGAVVSQYCQQSGAVFVLDTHSPALFSKRWRWTIPLQKLIARKAIVNILDQGCFRLTFESWGCRVVTLQRPPIRRVSSNGHTHSMVDPLEITVVNTFAADEPLIPIIDAANRLPDVHFSILGDTRLAHPKVFKNIPENITYTGYLKGDDYWNQIHKSQAILCLTTYSRSLLGGAQDGMMAEVPLILSRQPVLCEYFTKGCIFIENSAQGIVNGIDQLKQRYETLEQEIISLRAEKQILWEKNYEALRNIINSAIIQRKVFKQRTDDTPGGLPEEQYIQLIPDGAARPEVKSWN